MSDDPGPVQPKCSVRTSNNNHYLMKLFSPFIRKSKKKEHVLNNVGIDQQAVQQFASFCRMTAGEVMIPRSELVAAEVSSDLKQIMEISFTHGYSKILIYQENLDNILGYVRLGDLLPLCQSQQKLDLSKFMQPLKLVAATTPVLELAAKMHHNHAKMALVVDEYGGTDGLVVVNGIYEALFSRLARLKKHRPLLTKVDNNCYEADAKISVPELEQELRLDLREGPTENCETLGGLLVVLAGRVPPVGEVVTHPAGVEFTVMEANPKHVKQVVIKLYNAL